MTTMDVDDLHDTGACPVGGLCESCGTGERRLAAVTATTPVGVLCLTLCGPCSMSGMAPRTSLPAAARFVGEHCSHLGIDVDEMAEVLAGGDHR